MEHGDDPRSDAASATASNPADGDASLLTTSLNTVCQVIGAGVLALPFAMHNASVAVGSVLVVVFGILSVFATFLLSAGCAATQQFAFNELFAVAVSDLVSDARRWRQWGRSSGNCDAPGELPQESVINLLQTASAPGFSEDAEAHVPHPLVHVYGLRLRCVGQRRFAESRVRVWVSGAVDALVAFKNYGLLIAYARIIADAATPVVRDFFHGHGVLLDRNLWLGVAAVCFAVLTNARTFGELKASSFLGVATITYVVASIVTRFAQHAEQHDLSHEVAWTHVEPLGFLRAFATFSTAFAYHYNAPTYYLELERRSVPRIMRTVATTFPVIVVVYLAVGVAGCATFGAAVASKHAGGNIMNNYGTSDVVINVARLGLFLHLVCVYPVLSVSVRHAVHRLQLLVRGRRSQAESPGLIFATPRWQIAIEAVTIVASSVALAAVIPGIGFVFDLTGALVSTFVMVTHPGVVGVCILRDGRGPMQRATFWLCAAMVVAGVLFGAAGVVAVVLHAA